MILENEYIRLIFGLKLKQIRTERNLSLYGLSKITGLSKSYLNEIEKGKKYPKTDKIILLAKALEISYDQLVSLKLDKNLAPVGRIFQSKILKEIPLEHFGIKENTLIDIIANAPAKVNAFITTLIEIAQHYNFTRESFYLASLRSHQEANNNYFHELEHQIESFSKAFHIDLLHRVETSELKKILKEEYGYKIKKIEFEKHSNEKGLRSIYIKKTKTLLLSKKLVEQQIAFIYAKELAYNFLEYKERLYTFSWIKFDNFDQVINNFYASYFAGSLLISKQKVKEKLKNIFEQTEVNYDELKNLIQFFNASPQTFYHRLTNILPKEFNIQNLFFLRVSHKVNSKNYHIEKELNLISNPSLTHNDSDEYYNRRCVCVNVLKMYIDQKKSNLIDVQILKSPQNNNNYLIFSTITKSKSIENVYRIISLGILINKNTSKKIKFLNNPSLAKQQTKDLSEDYQIFDSQNRIAKPVALEQKEQNKATQSAVEMIIDKYSN